MDPKKDVIEVEGKVKEVLPNTLFRVVIDRSPDVSGKMRMHYIRLLEGDRVKIEMSPRYDLDKGRITFRLK